MNTYYFTFGSDHQTNSGKSLNQQFVRVTAESWNKAKSLFMTHFEPKMAPSKSPIRLRDQVEFEQLREFYPRGEHMVLHQLEDCDECEEANADADAPHA